MHRVHFAEDSVSKDYLQVEALEDVDATPLDADDDLFDVLKALTPVASRWKDIGRALRMKGGELDKIEAAHPGNPEDCLADMLSSWLKKNYNFRRFGEPTWRKLCEVVGDTAAGNNSKLASDIAKNHCERDSTAISDHKYSQADADLLVVKEEWYHGSISRQIAEDRLRESPNGHFLVRESETRKGCYSLSLKHGGEMMHYLIRRKQGGYVVDGTKKSFVTLTDVTKYYREHALSFKGEILMTSCENPKYRSWRIPTQSCGTMHAQADHQVQHKLEYRRTIADSHGDAEQNSTSLPQLHPAWAAHSLVYGQTSAKSKMDIYSDNPDAPPPHPITSHNGSENPHAGQFMSTEGPPPLPPKQYSSHGKILQTGSTLCTVCGAGLSTAGVAHSTSFTLHITDSIKRACASPHSVMAQLHSLVNGCATACKVKRKEETSNVYSISYIPSNRGRHELLVTVDEVNIKGSPFPVFVTCPPVKLGKPVKTIPGLSSPMGIAIQGSRVIVSEWQDNRVSIFDKSGKKLHHFGSHGKHKGQFDTPHGIAIDNKGFIFVADSGNNRIQKFTSDGKFVRQVGEKGRRTGQFNRPAGVVVNDDNLLCVCDSNNHRVQIFDTDLNFISTFGKKGFDLPDLNAVNGICLDSTGNLLVPDSNKHTIMKFSLPDGKYSGVIGSNLKSPDNICTDSQGFIYTSNYWHNCVTVLQSSGDCVTSFGKEGSSLAGQFRNPSGVAVDEDGFVYVCDQRNNRIHVF